MGIPFYYKHIITKYKNIITDKPPKCQAYYIDFNSVIHQCAGKVTQKFPKTYSHKDIIKNIIETTDEMIKKVKPSEYVYIGIDGVAPCAKMVQQRKRRYISSYRNRKIQDVYERNMITFEQTWDSNIITPGTQFMDELSIELHNNYSNFNKIHVCDVIISDSNEKGEGEQKLFDHMALNDDNMNIIISGLDADLLMLSLLSKKHIYLQRDEDTFIDISIFRKSISHHISGDENDIQSLYDYVVLCFLLGNDFIPGIPYLKIRDGAIDILIDIYREVINQEQNNKYLVNKTSDKYTINIQLLVSIFAKLSNIEPECFQYAVKHYMSTTHLKNYTSKSLDDYPNVLKKYINEIEHYPLLNKHPLLLNNNLDHAWNAKYYKYLFGSNDVDQIKLYTEKYIDGLLWTLNYYFNRQIDEHWYYEYAVAPMCADIYKTLFAFNMQHIDYKLDQLRCNSLKITISPQLQLLSVLPIQSVNCVPAYLQKVMLDPQHACLHYYPKEFSICTFLKKFLWECTPILPSIDMIHLYRTYIKVINDQEKSI